MTVIALWSPLDVLLGIVAPLGAAISAGTALVVDLDPNGPKYGGSFSLADLVTNGPTLDQLEPQRRGQAVLRNGGVEPADAEEVVAELVRRWPNVVLRCPQNTVAGTEAIALLPLIPEPFTPIIEGRSIYQATSLSQNEEGREPVLPLPRNSTMKSLLSGRRPPPGDRWIEAFRAVWEM